MLMTHSSKFLLLQRTCKIQYIPFKIVSLDIMSWMLANKLRLNNDKTEALLMYSPFKLFPASKPTSISVCRHNVSFSSSARNLGFYITETMNAELHIKNICRTGSYVNLHFKIVRLPPNLAQVLMTHTAKQRSTGSDILKPEVRSFLITICPIITKFGTDL